MKIRYMKQEALDILKSQLPSCYKYYYKNYDNSWIKDICGFEPFEEYRDIPSFELSPLSKSKGEIDFNNCKIIFSKLNFITESQACDERLWAGLCHDVFYTYMRRRWDMDKQAELDQKKSLGEIRTRFFFNGGVRSGSYRNTLSKCWWVGKCTYDNETKFKKLDIIGSNSISSKISDIFHNYNFVSNKTILNGIIYGIEYFNNNEIKYSTVDHLRPTLQYINAVGGGTLLDYWGQNEIKELFIEYMTKLIFNKEKVISVNNEELEEDEEDVINASAPEDFGVCVSLGDQIEVQLSNDQTSKVRRFNVNYIDNELSELFKTVIGLKVGDTFENEGVGYIILSIK